MILSLPTAATTARHGRSWPAHRTRICRIEMIAMQEIGLACVRSTVRHRTRHNVIPAHMRNFDVGRRCNRAHRPADPAQALWSCHARRRHRPKAASPRKFPETECPHSRTRRSIASIMPSMPDNASIQCAKAPTPGNTIRSAFATTSGSAVTTTSAAPAAFNALCTECRLPAP